MMSEELILSAERLAEFRGDVESLKRREQRFAQMLVDDFELLIAAAEGESAARRSEAASYAKFDAMHTRAIVAEKLVEELKGRLNERAARRMA